MEAIISKNGSVTDVRMEPAENGIIISYCVKTKKKSGGEYDNCSYDYKKEVFDIDGDEKEEGINEAFDRFKELWKQSNNM